MSSSSKNPYCEKCGTKRLLLGGGILDTAGPVDLYCPKCEVGFGTGEDENPKVTFDAEGFTIDMSTAPTEDPGWTAEGGTNGS